MRQRCHYKRHVHYANYGGRGIAVCAGWRGDYGAFLSWALANGYEAHLTIDRIDNDRGYEPSNCRWVSRLEQNQNIRPRIVMLEAFGEAKSIKEWSRDPRCRVGYKGLSKRLLAGEQAERAITRPATTAGRPKSVSS